jgi:sugar-specific transcriptional regulator TrmB
MDTGQAGQVLEPDLLAAVGLSADEVGTYRELIGRASAAASGTDVHDDALEQLVSRGLVLRHGEDYVAAPPELALEVLVRQREAVLQEVRRHAGELGKRYRSVARPGGGDGLLEILDGQETIANCYEQLQRSATREVLVFVKPPFAMPGDEALESESENLDHGVRYRAVYSRDALSSDADLNHVFMAAESGEEVRLVSELPMKLAIFDDRLAMLPFASPDGAASRAMLVRPSGLLDALRLLFEMFWERGVSLPGTREEIDVGEGPTQEELRLLALIGAGLKDEAIAYRLGLSPRTVRRRIARLMERLGADNRFVAGYQAAKRGWM